MDVPESPIATTQDVRDSRSGVELVANNLAARCVNGLGRGVPWWEGNKCKHDLLPDRTCDGESPSDEGQRRGEEGTKERDSRSGGNT